MVDKDTKGLDRLTLSVAGAVSGWPGSGAHPDQSSVTFIYNLYHPPGDVAQPQPRTHMLLQFGDVSLDPPLDRRMIHADAAILEHHFKVPIADGKRQIAQVSPHP